jgi:beta-glucanase (GH16 family)
LKLLKVVAAVILATQLAGCKAADGSQFAADPAFWVAVWSDEFDDDVIDGSRWNFVSGAGGYGNNELQNYTDRAVNARIEKGVLIIEAHAEDFEGSSYTSAKLTTESKAEWEYGRFEFRARLPGGQGIWPAIWMMPSDYEAYGPWPSSGEIDIVELVGHEPATVHGTLHYGNPHSFTGDAFALSDGTFSDQFHHFALEWDPGEIRWYVDGSLYQTLTNWYSQKDGEAAEYTWPAPFDREFYLQLNLAVGGNWPGYPDASTEFPQKLEVDYVRVYERIEPLVAVESDEPEDATAPEGRAPTADGNYVHNAGFDNEFDLWEFGNYEGGSGSALWESGEAHIAISEPGNQIWASQLIQQEMHVEQGVEYRVSFRARAEAERQIMIKIGGEYK